MSELYFKTATQLARGYRRGDCSPVEVINAVLARIDHCESQLNAWRLVDKKRARVQARASEKRWFKGEPRGVLDGVPVAIKDVTETKIWPTRNGSLVPERRSQTRVDAIVVERLKREGAILLGKTQTPEFAWLGVTQSALHGITRNPWNTDWTPGGSSGGSGAAVAAGMTAIATGTDSGGSIRGPASFCGVVGFKPTFGRVPVWPASPLMEMEHCGPIARCVRDAALAFYVMAGGDSRDGFAIQHEAPAVMTGLDRGVKGLKIGFSPDLGVPRVDDEVRKTVSEARHVFTGLDAVVSRVKLDLGDARKLSYAICNPMAARIRSRLGKKAARLSNKVFLSSADDGEEMSALEYLEAEAKRTELRGKMTAFHEKYDLLICPTLACAPFPVGYAQPPHWRNRDGEFMAMATPFDLTGQPAISVPCGFSALNAPIGLQIVGAYGEDALVLKAARAFEKAMCLGQMRPPI
jgi:aspartyl-tRNA(Asn)/glutamyl-tRNA(Gln) amidotransferase subunit A